MFGYDPELDYANRSNPEVHYRLYVYRGELTVICVQDFDYCDYDDNMFVDYRSFERETFAWKASIEFIRDARSVCDHG